MRTPGSRATAYADGGTVPASHDGWMWDLTVPGNNDHDFYVLPAKTGGHRTYYAVAGTTPVLAHNIDEPRLCDLTLGAGPNAREGVALPGGDKDAPGVQELTNEAGDKYGCHTCGAPTPGTGPKPGRPQGNWITDHQGATRLVEDAPFDTYQTGYPHCWPCARQQAGVVTQILRGSYEFDPEP